MSNPEEDIDRLEKHVTRLEQSFFAEVKDINRKLGAMEVQAASKRDCAEPNLCIHLRMEMNKLWEKVDSHGLKIQQLEKWQYAAMAIIALFMLALTLFGPSLRALCHLP